MSKMLFNSLIIQENSKMLKPLQRELKKLGIQRRFNRFLGQIFFFFLVNVRQGYSHNHWAYLFCCTKLFAFLLDINLQTNLCPHRVVKQPSKQEIKPSTVLKEHLVISFVYFQVLDNIFDSLNDFILELFLTYLEQCFIYQSGTYTKRNMLLKQRTLCIHI